MAFCHDEVRRSPRSNRREVVEEFWVDLGRIKVIEMVEAHSLVGELFLLFSSLVERESKISFFFYFSFSFFLFNFSYSFFSLRSHFSL